MTLLPPAHKVTGHLVLIRSARIRPVPTHQAWDDQGLGTGGTVVSPSPSRLKAPHTVSRDGVALATGARFPSSNLRGSRWSWFLRIQIPCPPRSHNMCGTEFHLRNPAPPGVVYRRARGERCLMVSFKVPKLKNLPRDASTPDCEQSSFQMLWGGELQRCCCWSAWRNAHF